MELIVERVDVWAAGIKDQPGSLAGILRALAEAGADLDFVIARRSPETPGTGVIFVTPLRGDAEIAAAADLGFSASNSLHSVRIEGPNQPGIGAQITEILAEAQINLRGFSASVIGPKFIAYLAIDTEEEAQKAIDLLKQA